MKKYILLFFIAMSFQNCNEYTCNDRSKDYRDVELNIKIEKLSKGGGRNYTIEGKDKNGIYKSWKDFSNWILAIHQNISIGDSIIKLKGKTYLMIKKQHDTTSRVFYLECEGRIIKD